MLFCFKKWAVGGHSGYSIQVEQRWPMALFSISPIFTGAELDSKTVYVHLRKWWRKGEWENIR